MTMSEEIKQIGKYQIRGELGRGAMGVVYRGFDPLIEREVAIKTLRADLLEGAEHATILERFKKEAQAAGRLNHPNIVQVFEYGVDGDQVFIVMELIQGRELTSFLAEAARFDQTHILRMMRELLDALGFAHRHGVVHRDIKPSNIVVLPDGRIKVTDFGIARLESSTLTQAGNILGTPSYMSPEQFMAQRVDGRSDLFSAGVVLYELLTGEKPFAGNSFATIMHKALSETPVAPSMLNITLSRAFDAVVAKAMAKRPDERFQDAQAFIQALNDVETGNTVATSATFSQDATLAVDVPTQTHVDATVALGRQADATVVMDPHADATVVMGRPASTTMLEQTVVMTPGATNASPSVSPPVTTSHPAPDGQKKSTLKLYAIVGGLALALAVGGVAFMSGGDNSEAQSTTNQGTVSIVSDPPGAVVLINGGEFGGVTPAKLELPPGVHQILIQKDGHNQLESSVEVVANTDVPFQAMLTPIE
jgi:eukaryotic-like serine/threonine-protein kinase